ncbi:MAG: T9SS type A sorting domain-containing protein, partial [Bacteroidota bacterium]
ADYGLFHRKIDDGFIIGGYSYDVTLTTTQVFLLKTDNLGNIEWQQEYGDIGHDDLKSIDFTADDGYIIGGDFENPVTGSWDLYLLKTDSLGNEEWKEYYGTPYSDRKGYGIATADSGYAIVGYTTDATGEIEGYVVKTDSLGGVQWEKTYGIPNYNDYFKFIQQLPDGKFMIAGGKADTTTANGRLVWLLKMDTTGDTLWTKSYTYYGENTHTYVEDLQLTNDGGFVMTGYIAGNPRPNKNDLWLLKTDSLGNTCEIDTATWEGCSEPLSVVEMNSNNKAGNIIIYPNPAEEYITIESYDQAIRKVEISDIHGRIVESVCNINTGSENIYLSGLRAGIYFVRVQCDQFVKTLKIVKQ